MRIFQNTFLYFITDLMPDSKARRLGIVNLHSRRIRKVFSTAIVLHGSFIETLGLSYYDSNDYSPRPWLDS